MMYYLVKVKVETDNGNGKIKKNTEQYLVKAVSVTDAEAHITAFLQNSPLEFEVSSVTQTKILNVVGN
jgi:predicted RNA-binding protein Jag